MVGTGIIDSFVASKITTFGLIATIGTSNDLIDIHGEISPINVKTIGFFRRSML
jgi:hypothetical protein